VRHKDLNALDFDALCTEAFNEEQSIKCNEAQSNINRGSALTAGKGKETGNGKEEASANKSQEDSGKTSSRRSSKHWRCKTHKTNKRAWFDCPENPNGKN
jgi:hypothetical protein